MSKINRSLKMATHEKILFAFTGENNGFYKSKYICGRQALE
jgi:hypothetical protein